MLQKDISVTQASLPTKYKNNVFNTIINKRLTISDVPENRTKKKARYLKQNLKNVKNTASNSENKHIPQLWA